MLSDKDHVKQMQLFNFMNCLEVGRQTNLSLHHHQKKKDPSVALGTPSVTLRISRQWRMSSEQRI